MAVPDQFQLLAINEIAEALSSNERSRLFYLCESLDTDHSVACMKEMLRSKVTQHQNAHLFLAELMWRLGRLDILRKVCKVNRDDLERTRQMVPRFRVLMTELSEELDTEDLDSIKFLLSCKLSREKLEKTKSFLDIIVELEKLDSVSPERLNVVEDCLTNIGRIDLVKKLTTYKNSAGAPEQQQNLSLQQPCRISHVTQERRIGVSPRSGARLGPSSESQPDCYKFNTNPRGHCVIIDCVGNDGEKLEQTFKALHFSVDLYQYLSSDEVFSALENILDKMEKLRNDSFVCCIISRGTESQLWGTDSTGNGFSTNEVRRLFNANRCPLLAGKPKLFFIQRYNVPKLSLRPRMNPDDGHLETDGCDGAVTAAIPMDADVFWSHCWTDECQLEEEEHSSVYVKALTNALIKAQNRKIKIDDIQMEVNNVVFEHSRINPQASYHLDVKHTLRRDLYLQ
ncbi:CASP8 and FADD-like apoptosis regulator isoform X2 [Neolamprologus brichardi]|uniref:CASP8 and FADD-like apoptosis regulator isoform X2 n=1 Tax=Neolamprologus brichardi TaxID=32507 RepID=UPI00164370B2|nr:CASP8 and FADD-like apoptosis regulator isoform X2 [Neolamprologus brichardi]